MGKILSVDLTFHDLKEEPLPDEQILRLWVGGQGLAQYLLWKEQPKGIHVFDPESRIIVMTGPLTGTGLTPGGTDATIASVNPEDGRTFNHAHSHGYWGPRLKFSGYDGIVIKGASEKPIMLWLHDGKAEILDAGKYWGKGTFESEDQIKNDLGYPDASATTIGPAGENVIPYSMVCNDKNHNFAHGAGAIWGSKKLKAIAVYGKQAPPIADEERLTEVGSRWREKTQAIEWLAKYRQRYGIIRSKFGIVNKNWKSSIFDDFDKGWDREDIVRRGCFECVRKCPYDVVIAEGKHKGMVAHLNPGGEGLEGAASVLGVGGEDVRYLTHLSNQLGLQAQSFGNTLAIAFEAYENGFLTEKDTDGVPLVWGNVDSVEKMMRKVVERDGWLAKAIAGGPKECAKAIGHNAHQYMVYVRSGLSPNMHEYRGNFGAMLGQAVGGGTGWYGSGFDGYGTEPDIGYPEPTDPLTVEGKPMEIKMHNQTRQFYNAAGVCWFGIAREKPGSLTDVVESLQAATGWKDFTVEEALTVGERLTTHMRLLDMERGLTPEVDLDLGPRFMEPKPDGDRKGSWVKPNLEKMVRDYYELMGWDRITGRPLPTTLDRLSIM